MEVLVLERTPTELDHIRLTNLVHRDSRDGSLSSRALHIGDELDATVIVPSRQVAPDVVTMYSQEPMVDSSTGQRSQLRLCHPAHAEPGAGFVCVPSPVGGSLLGRHVGCATRWLTPAGSILFQLKASGDYSM
jgi:regulator of nucleoside diphosphate kinase